MGYYDRVVDSLFHLKNDRNVLCKTHWNDHYRDEVRVLNEYEAVYLYHGIEIARYNKKEGKLVLTNAGWLTPSTRDRLNKILGRAGIRMTISIRDKHGLMYLWDDEWNIGLLPKQEFKIVVDVVKRQIANLSDFWYYLPASDNRKVYYPAMKSLANSVTKRLWKNLGYVVHKSEYGDQYAVYFKDKYYKLYYRTSNKDYGTRYFEMIYHSSVGGYIGVEIINDLEKTKKIDLMIRKALAIHNLFKRGVG